MENTKRVLAQYLFYDAEGIVSRLEKMAAKGWLLTETGRYLWTYRKIEPRRLRFAVTYFADSSEYDPDLTEEQQTLVDYCEKAGWTFAARWYQMFLFWTDDPEAVALETDEDVKLSAVHESQSRAFLPGNVIFLVMLALGAWGVGYRYLRDPVQWLSNRTELLLLALLALMLWEIFALAGYGVWYLRSKWAVARGGVCVKAGRVCLCAEAVLLVAAVALVVCQVALKSRGGLDVSTVMNLVRMPILLAVVLGVSNTLRARKASRTKNQVLSIAALVVLAVALGAVQYFADTSAGDRARVTAEELPLRMEDLTGRPASDRDDCWRWESASSLMGYFSGMDLSGPGLDYEIATPGRPGLYEVCRKAALSLEFSEMDDYHIAGMFDRTDHERWVEADPAPWGAETAYQKEYDGNLRCEYVLCYPDRVVSIFFGWSPSAEQMAIAGEKLGKA